MKNLEQIRAKNALVAAPQIKAGKEGGRAVAKKVPTQIIENGFLGALAFALEAKEGYLSVFEAIETHLRDRDIGALAGFTYPAGDLEKFLAELCTKDAATLRAITDESMKYLNYLRRFAKPAKE